MTPNTFNRDMRAEQKKIIAETTEAVRSIGLGLFADLNAEAKTLGGGAFGSPVASGRYAASMRLAVNEIDTSAAPDDPNYHYPAGHGQRALPPRTIPNMPIAAVAARLRTFKLGDTIYISNSVPYVRRIEIGKHSWQTPDGVFEKTVARFLGNIAGALRKYGVTIR